MAGKTVTPRRRKAVAHITGMLAVGVALAASAGRAPAQGASAVRRDYTSADVAFVQGMIVHHAQAVIMSDWAPTHGARPSLVTLCRRIALSQRDEIGVMQHWLAERRLPVPDPLHMRTNVHDSSAVTMSIPMSMPGMDMAHDSAPMPGMLTPAQMRALDAARGPEFDRLFLTGMLRHHQGALDMVATLFSSPGSGQQADLFGFATDVDAGQRAEMGRMQVILNTLNTSPTR